MIVLVLPTACFRNCRVCSSQWNISVWIHFFKHFLVKMSCWRVPNMNKVLGWMFTSEFIVSVSRPCLYCLLAWKYSGYIHRVNVWHRQTVNSGNKVAHRAGGNDKTTRCLCCCWPALLFSSPTLHTSLFLQGDYKDYVMKNDQFGHFIYRLHIL